MKLLNTQLREKQYVFMASVVSIATGISYLLDSWLLPKVGILLIFQLAVVTVSFVCEKLSAIFAGLLSALIYNFLFTEPRYSFHMSDAEDIVNLLVFIVTATITSHLASYYRHQQQELKKAQLRSSILLSVSHDLRTPLSTIMGSLSTLQAYKEQLPEGEQDELLQGALEETHRLHRYIENLLQATKLQHGEFQLNAAEQDILPIVESVVARIRSSRINLLADSHLPAAKVRQHLLEQALYNLIDNALKYSPAETMVSINITAVKDWLHIDISDQGPGIPLHYRQKVFEIFYSARKGDTGEGGTGLGLPVAKGIIAAHGGKLELLNADNGCTLRAYLPAVEEVA